MSSLIGPFHHLTNGGRRQTLVFSHTLSFFLTSSMEEPSASHSNTLSRFICFLVVGVSHLSVLKLEYLVRSHRDFYKVEHFVHFGKMNHLIIAVLYN